LGRDLVTLTVSTCQFRDPMTVLARRMTVSRLRLSALHRTRGSKMHLV
jgi:hypothetical protein